MYVRRSGDRRKRATFDFVKEGKLQKQAQIGRLRVRVVKPVSIAPWPVVIIYV